MKLKYINIKNLYHLVGPIPISLLDILEEGLEGWNKEKGVPSKIIKHNKKNHFIKPASFNKDMAGVVPMHGGRGAQFLVAPNKSHGADTLFVIQMEPPLFPCMTSIELSLRYILKGTKNLKDKYTIYLHSFVMDKEPDYVYYGITKRSPIERFKEHLNAAKQDSHLLFHQAIRNILPKAKQVHHVIIAAGVSQEQAYDTEEYLVDKYSLYPNHKNGLNMIPGGNEGIRQLHKLGILNDRNIISPEKRESKLIQYLSEHPRRGIPNPLVSEKWLDDEYAEAVICGAKNRLSAKQVREIRGLVALGYDLKSIFEKVKALNIQQVQNVLRGKTYSRIK